MADTTVQAIHDEKVKMWVNLAFEALRASPAAQAGIDIGLDKVTARWIGLHVTPVLTEKGILAYVINYKHPVADKDSVCDCDYGCSCPENWSGRKLTVSMR